MIFRPLKANTPLPVDTNAELPLAIAAERFKSVAGQEHQIVLVDRRLENIQAPFRLLPECLKLPHSLSGGKSLCPPVPVLR